MDFAKIIRYLDLPSFLIQFGEFAETDYPQMISFYEGKTRFISKGTFEKLKELESMKDDILSRIEQNKLHLSDTIESWDLVETIEEISSKIQTIRNTPKWSRSSVDIDFNSQQIIEEVLKGNQTLEGLVYEKGSTDSDNDWVNVALYNQLKEDDYEYSGEKSISLRVRFFITSQPINSVDIMVGDNVLGKDIHRDIIIEDEDLLTLLPQDTLQQCAEINISVLRGSLQEFPELGVTKEQISTNINSLQFPSIFRQLSEVFNQDDAFASIELIDYGIDEDSASMKFLIRSRTGGSIEQEFRIFDDTHSNIFN